MPQSSLKSLEEIRREPFISEGTVIVQAQWRQRFPEILYKALIQRLKKRLPEAEHARFDKENEQIIASIKENRLLIEPNFHDPVSRLLWAIHGTYRWARNRKEPFTKTKLWRDLTNSRDAQIELGRHAIYLARDKGQSQTKLAWGTPGSAFYFNQEQDYINDDFLMSLSLGFSHTRGAIFHEIGHERTMWENPPLFLESRKRTKAMAEELLEKWKNGEEIPLDQRATLARERRFQKLFFRIVDEAENSTANRYCVNAGPRIFQDLSSTLNRTEAVIARPRPFPAEAKPTPETLLKNLKQAIRMTFYQGNGLFEDTEEGWASVGVKIDWLQSFDQPPLKGRAALDELIRLCAGPEGLQHLQPDSVDRMCGPSWVEKRVRETAAQRNEIIQNDLWARFAGPLAAPLLDKAEQDVYDKAQKQDKESQEESDDPNKKTQKQSDEPAEEQKDGKGEDQGKPGEGSAPSPSEPEPEEDWGSDGTGSFADGGDEGEGGDSEEPDDPFDGPDPESLLESLLNPKKGKPSQNGEAPPDSKTMEQLLKLMDRLEKQGLLPQTKDGQDSEAQTPGDKPLPKIGGPLSQRGMATIKTAGPLPIGDWSDYRAAMEQYAAAIAKAHYYLLRIQDMQTQKRERLSGEHDMMPEDGDSKRLDAWRQERLIKKIIQGETIDERDVERFKKDEPYNAPAQIDIAVLTDGSGSMFSTGWFTVSSQPLPFHAGIQTGGILNEAARAENWPGQKSDRARINMWQSIWGDAPPDLIAHPGDDPELIGKRIAGLLSMKDRDCGTSLAPAIISFTKDIANYKAPADLPSGCVHMLVISDGDIEDKKDFERVLNDLMTHVSRVTMDVIIVNEDRQTAMEATIKKIKQNKPACERRLNMRHVTNVLEVHEAALEILKSRMLKTAKIEAIPHAKRSGQFRKALHTMEKNSPK